MYVSFPSLVPHFIYRLYGLIIFPWWFLFNVLLSSLIFWHMFFQATVTLKVIMKACLLSTCHFVPDYTCLLWITASFHELYNPPVILWIRSHVDSGNCFFKSSAWFILIIRLNAFQLSPYMHNDTCPSHNAFESPTMKTLYFLWITFHNHEHTSFEWLMVTSILFEWPHSFLCHAWNIHIHLACTIA